MRDSLRPIDSVLADHAKELMSLPDVVGLGQGEKDGKPCIEVYAARSNPELTKRVPGTLEGWPVVVLVTGEFRAHDSTK